MTKSIIYIFALLLFTNCSNEQSEKETKATQVKVEESVIKDSISLDKSGIDSSKLEEKNTTDQVVGNSTDSNVSEKAKNTSSENNEEKAVEIPIEKVPEEKVQETIKEDVKKEKLSHTTFNNLLKKYVTSVGNVNYTGLKTDKLILDNYLSLLSNNSPNEVWSRNEKLAYWINLYNAATIQLILNNFPVNSIMDINGGKAWDVKFIKSGTKILTLNQIENEIIRPTFKEPRIHFAVNCAAQSCPKLLNAAFIPTTLESQLETATKKFINNSTKNDLSESSISISKIFDWYAIDFGGKENLVNYLNKYANTTINSNASLTFKEYDWSLNN